MDCEFISSVERYNITIVTGMIIPIPEKRYSEVREEIAEIMEGEIIRHLDSEHPSDYTFDRMKEMHDYILSRGRSKGSTAITMGMAPVAMVLDANHMRTKEPLEGGLAGTDGDGENLRGWGGTNFPIISRYIGSHTVKADPSSGRLSTSIRPWHSEMILLTRARPRPFPSMFRLCSPW